jgi:hypothetical protein
MFALHVPYTQIIYINPNLYNLCLHLQFIGKWRKTTSCEVSIANMNIWYNSEVGIANMNIWYNREVGIANMNIWYNKINKHKMKPFNIFHNAFWAFQNNKL